MKNLIILLFLLSVIACGQTLKGKIYDIRSGLPLQDANVMVKNTSAGTTSNIDGEFELKDIKKGSVLVISYIGYDTKEAAILPGQNYIEIPLVPGIIPSQTVLVKGSVGKIGITPVVVERITQEEIQANYSVQDIPQFLSSQPSVMSYSENGNGIGYNYLSIRGFDQRRISVSVNGIPQNDPEDHNVYWLDFPDILGSSDLVQVQRGAGGGLFSYPAVGGSVNIITSSMANTMGFRFETFIGSYNTRKYSASFSSGLIGNKYSFYAKLSRILSSGYRDLSWVKFNAYHFSAVRYDDRLTTQVNFYGGPVEDGLAYTGLPKFAVKDNSLRKKNFSYWETDGNRITYSVDRRPEEIENFTQPHFEVLNDYTFSDNVKFNSALFMVLGNGFFDYDGSWGDTTYFRLTHENGFSPTGNPVNALIRAEVSNTQYGWIPRLSYSHENGDLLIGGEFRIHRSRHWGNINYAENLPAGISKEYQYYFYRGARDILNAFIQENYNLNERVNFLGEIQIAYNKYRLYDEKFLNTEFEVPHLFINPRAGINYRLSEYQNIFISFARVSREPRLKNYYDAAESSGGETPLFEKREDGTYDFNSPLVRPETMNDFEMGTSFINEKLYLSLNLFYMFFDDEIIKNGKLDRFGQPVTGNANQTLHRGIETAASVRIMNGFELWANATYSQNIIKKTEYFISSSEFIDLSNNRISGFPDVMANFGIKYSKSGFESEFSAKYVGEFYSDNYDKNLKDYLLRYPGFVSYLDNKNDAYFTADLIASYERNLFGSAIPSRLYLRINNLFNKLYSAYAIGQEFFPAAERNFTAGLQLGL